MGSGSGYIGTGEELVRRLALVVAQEDGKSVLESELFWAIIAAAAGVLAVVVAIAIYVKSRTRPALAYEVTVTPLLSDKAPGSLEIRYEGVPVRAATLVDVDVRNVGNAAIRSDDFESDLSVVFEPGVLVLAGEVTATQPPDLKPSFSSGTVESMSVEPLLLNAGDGFTVQILASEFNGNVELEGRIAGITDFQRSYVTPEERLLRSTVAGIEAAGIWPFTPVAGAVGPAVVQLLERVLGARRGRGR